MTPARLAALISAAVLLPVVGGSATVAAGAAAELRSAFVTRDVDGVGYYLDGHGPAEAWESPASTISLSEPGVGVLEVRVGTSTAVARLTTGDGAALRAGTYPLKPAETLTADAARLVLVDGHLDNDFASGTLTVRELVRDGAGAVTAFAADVVGVYAGHDSHVKGTRTMSLRHRSAVGYTAVRSTPNAYLGSSELGVPTAPGTVTMTVGGTQPVRFGTSYADVDPSSSVDAGPYEITSDGCAGRQLTSGQSCTVTVRGVPLSKDQVDGHVVVPDDTTSSRTSVTVSTAGYVNPSGRYQDVTPSRLYDSRAGRPFAAGETRRMKVTGRAGVPAGNGFSVLLSVTAVSPAADGHLTVFHQHRPASSNVNFRRGATRANLVTTLVWTDGTVAVYSSAAAHVLVDVVGYFDPPTTDGSQLEPVEPTRVLDTRHDVEGALAGREAVDVALDFGSEVNPDVTGVVVNLTAVAPTTSGHLTAWDGDTAPPTVSSLNFAPGATVPVLAFVPTSHLDDGSVVFSVLNGGTGFTHLLVDVVGYLDSAAVEGLRYFPTGGERLLDTRTGKGLSGPFGPKQTRDVKLGSPWYKHVDTAGLLLNLTSVKPTAPTYLTAWDHLPGEAPPRVSNLNAVPGDIVSNAALTFLTATDGFGIHNNSGSTHVVGDVLGVWDLYPGSRGATPATAGAGATLRATASRD